MALPGQLQYFPLRHLIGAGLGILLLLILVLLPDSGESTKQQTFVIDLPEVSEPERHARTYSCVRTWSGSVDRAG